MWAVCGISREKPGRDQVGAQDPRHVARDLICGTCLGNEDRCREGQWLLHAPGHVDLEGLLRMGGKAQKQTEAKDH